MVIQINGPREIRRRFIDTCACFHSVLPDYVHISLTRPFSDEGNSPEFVVLK